MERAYLRNPADIVVANQPQSLASLASTSLFRALLSWTLAAITTLLLILAMAQLITTQFAEPEPEFFPNPQSIHLPKLTPTVQKFQPPQRVVEPQVQPTAPRMTHEVDPGEIPLNITPPSTGKKFTGPASMNTAPVPIFKPAAQYPASALRRGLEGYVVVEFSIGKNGNVINAKVVGGYDASDTPTAIFNRSALAAVKRFKYRPQMQDGKAIVRHGVHNRISFKLE
ncbi:hypothetical protein Maes01_01745 [Microbulbifer aestuariivivens]|uniref:Protein TonB n=1 Tax=Microbulbifer aestuariivivens TaxID=1908308 RepID=A0ABP9WQ18_9GAMM